MGSRRSVRHASRADQVWLVADPSDFLHVMSSRAAERDPNRRAQYSP